MGPTRERVFLDPCPDSVWEQLPGGPQALNEELGESWEYMGSVVKPGDVRHQFRHRAHPLFVNSRIYAEVVDDGNGPQLGVVPGFRELRDLQQPAGGLLEEE